MVYSFDCHVLLFIENNFYTVVKVLLLHLHAIFCFSLHCHFIITNDC